MDSQGHVYTQVRSSLVEVELYAQHAAAENSRLREKLVMSARPMLTKMFLWQEISLLSLTLAAWTRYIGGLRLQRAAERHGEASAAHWQSTQGELEAARAQVVRAGQHNADLEEQLEQATAYAAELDQERKATADREAWFRNRLAEAERCIKHLDRDGLSNMHLVRQKMQRYKAYKSSAEPALSGDRQGDAELQAIHVQLEQIARRLNQTGAAQTPSASHPYATPSLASPQPGQRWSDSGL
mmetsp:Transcript_50911/g.131259  ORF Transcript_50911/g.131259 Transcript_50911/m.131259 type:complete len:241 (-) Transcript_50911:64-786(-)